MDQQVYYTVDSGPFQIRGQINAFLTLRLIAPNDDGFFPKLRSVIGVTPGFFRYAPVVLDAAPVADQEPPDLAAFGRRLREQELVPIGIQNGSEAWNRAAVDASLGVLPAAWGAHKELRAPAPPSTPAIEPVRRRGPSLIVDGPVRAGQQIYAENSDLVVLALVSPGAELLADGHIHVYGPLRGRAHAGLGGDEGARIFCQSLEAQLVSVAGYYLVSDEIDETFHRRRVQVRCCQRSLVIESLP